MGDRRFPWIALGLALAVRLAWLGFAHPVPQSDFGWYFEEGQNLAAGRGYVVDHDGCPMWERGAPLLSPRPTAFWPIGYPLFLAGVFRVSGNTLDPLLAAKLANVALALGSMGILAWCATRMFRSRLAGSLALLLLAFLPNHIAYVSITSSEILYSFLVSAGLALLVLDRERERIALRLAAGVVLGLATWTKPQAVLLPGVVLALLYFGEWKRLVRDLALVALVIALTLVPLWMRNQRVFGRFVFVSTNGGINLVIGNTPGAYAPGVFWNRALTELVRGETGEVERDHRAKAMAIDWVRRHPLQAAAALPAKFVALYAADVDGFGWNRAGDPRRANNPVWLALRLLSQAYYLAIGVLALLSWRDRNRFEPRLSRVGVGVFLHVTAVYLAFFGGARFHFPLVPWIALHAAATLAVRLEKNGAGAGSAGTVSGP